MQYDPTNPNAGRGGFGFGGGRGTPDPNRLTAAQVAEEIDAMLVSGGAVLRVNDAARGEGVIVAQQNRAYDPAKAVPTVILRNDDFGRVERLLADGDDVKMEFHIVNHVYPDGKTSYNAIAEIPGSDKADEVVMMGGHLDSWHAATGATDNAIGCSIMVEAARLHRDARAQAAPHHPGGAVVRRRGGAARLARLRGAALRHGRESQVRVVQARCLLQRGHRHGPSARRRSLRTAARRPRCFARCWRSFADWGMAGAMSTASRNVAGTDSTSFNHAGLPGIGMSQDPIEYNTMTHHTNLDTYERIIPDDVEKAAAIIAAAVWNVANRDEMVPRFSKDAMPAPVAVR